MSIAENPIPNQTWEWRGLPINYQQVGNTGPALVLIHGFGASVGHWRKTIPALAENHRVFALDLLGFGKSAKPAPGEPLPYDFDTWGTQVAEFLQQVVGEPAFLVGNSIGAVVALQAAVIAPYQVRGVALLDCALRQICDRKLHTQPPMRRLGRPLLKKVLKNRALVHWLFAQIARPDRIRAVLRTAYGNPEAVTDELIELLLEPAREPGAADVFWAFINNFDGPLPEDLLPQITCPALILWGTADPWEPIALGRELANFPAVEAFIPLEGAGHCPQDEIPVVVNGHLETWVARHAMAAPVCPSVCG
ncbi:alpha/beta fold hydrolase [Nodosilinea sp. LEGE 07298]|uniref:alpha/beta fold hydrolase n=1 Tax=Nodosilinea sp. LEGE 07298 TaxID=2777970 RepID=UPI00188142EC|nr:alpha/beta fold hydrolase [Nodosilinea sp. LEGE 07298]MBE9110079.1 alpha/beta fold hydrolase [Nodosilinea sp. LEGE 07298]